MTCPPSSYYLCIVMLTATLVGCTSVKKDDFQEKFVTEIRQDGSKMFNFSLISHQKVALDRQGAKQKRANKEQGQQNKKQRNKKTSYKDKRSTAKALEELMYQRLELALADNQYCRSGYIELAQNIDTQIASVRGECNESANEGDHKKFK